MARPKVRSRRNVLVEGAHMINPLRRKHPAETWLVATCRGLSLICRLLNKHQRLLFRVTAHNLELNSQHKCVTISAELDGTPISYHLYRFRLHAVLHAWRADESMYSEPTNPLRLSSVGRHGIAEGRSSVGTRTVSRSSLEFREKRRRARGRERRRDFKLRNRTAVLYRI